MRKIQLYWHTLRYLKGQQLIHQLLRRLRKPRPKIGTALPLRQRTGDWVSPVSGKASYRDDGTFTLLGESGRLPEIGWNGPERTLIWRYNQHYFADLLAGDAGQRGAAQDALIADWVQNNPPGQGVGWDAYPTSLRIVAWIKWALAGNVLSREAQESLANQARWLSRTLEWHLLGNHLFVNAKALVFAGLWFEGEEAETWRDIGLRVLAREVPEQILSDGGHFELSPMYHILALEDVLDLVNIGRCFRSGLGGTGDAALADWQRRVPGMLSWLATMCHPDGEIGFFNDAAIGIAPSPSQIASYSERLGTGTLPKAEPGIHHLPDSGYARIAAGPAVMLADAARVGPDYLPGHAHADSLSFELSLQGHRMICNSGTSLYGTSAERLRQRGTGAHATLMLDGENSSEVWSGFRVARRARVSDVQTGADGAALTLAARHDGYARLPGRPIHSRSWTLAETALTVEDRVDGQGNHRAEVLFPLAPGWQPHVAGDRTIRLDGPDGIRAIFSVAAGMLEVEPFTYHPNFGASLPNWLIRLTVAGPLPLTASTTIDWKSV